MPKQKETTTPVIEQIEYHDWSDKLAPGHESYWAHIGYIAHFIASLLEGWQTKFKSDPNNPDKTIAVPEKYNTILVSSYKEKFGEIRVYWYPANNEMVEQNYIDYKNRHANSTNYHNKTELLTLEQYREQCYRQDLLHYRNVYYIMKQCFPQYWNVISSSADNTELLYETKEEYLEAMNKDILRTKNEYRPTFLEKQKDFIFDLLKWT